MQDRKLRELLRNPDEDTAVRIGEQYPPFSEAENDRIFRRIEAELQQYGEASEAETFTIQPAPRRRWTRPLSAAACLLVMCGTFAGILAMKQHMPAPTEQTDATGQSAEENQLAHAVGERFAAENLTKDGTLWLTVMTAGMRSDGEYYIRVRLESDGAVSHVPEQPEMFLADNLMLAFAQSGGNWKTVQPCAAGFSDTAAAYAFTIHSGDTLELELCYALEEAPEECRLVTSYDISYPYAQWNKEK